VTTVIDRNPVGALCEIESETVNVVNVEGEVFDTIDAVMPVPLTWTDVAPANSEPFMTAVRVTPGDTLFGEID